MVELNQNIKIMIVSKNDLYTPLKDRVCIKQQELPICSLKETNFKYEWSK